MCYSVGEFWNVLGDCGGYKVLFGISQAYLTIDLFSWNTVVSRNSSVSYSCCLVAQSCRTLCNPVGCSLPGSSVHGISQARVLEWVAISSTRGSSSPRDWTEPKCISWNTIRNVVSGTWRQFPNCSTFIRGFLLLIWSSYSPPPGGYLPLAMLSSISFHICIKSAFCIYETSGGSMVKNLPANEEGYVFIFLLEQLLANFKDWNSLAGGTLLKEATNPQSLLMLS